MKEVIMVMARKTLKKAGTLSNGYEIEINEDTYTLKNRNEVLASARLGTDAAFSSQRKAILEPESEAGIAQSDLQALIARMVLDYEKTPSKYPIYVRLLADNLEWITLLSRMEFTPYLGSWGDIQQEDSEQVWEEIARNLKERAQ